MVDLHIKTSDTLPPVDINGVEYEVWEVHEEDGYELVTLRRRVMEAQ